ncbi:fas apoptotic inhibitory molecule 1 isoform X1 [Panthera leo]|uniref:fas apoptotic inhibitory molecule 1 isoform X1 n=2 Tax=Panthera leo TaxID=9689 RepID=UPI001C6955DF|nr:fas apoptotic inhibitory molecule 1 isoform X1 [Panthera leo]
MASGDDSPIFEDDESPPYSLEKMTDLVAVWDVALSDGVHKIEFEHGTTSGKRVVYVDGKEEIRKEWMFKLVGKETFCVGAAKTKATINIDAISGFAYEYTLEINGKSLKKYMENRSKTTNTWVLHLDGEDFRVVLEKDTMDVWCNGKRMETASSQLAGHCTTFTEMIPCSPPPLCITATGKLGEELRETLPRLLQLTFGFAFKCLGIFF